MQRLVAFDNVTLDGYFVKPVVLGSGKRLFDRITRRLDLELTRTRTFGNGSVFLCYAAGA